MNKKQPRFKYPLLRRAAIDNAALPFLLFILVLGQKHLRYIKEHKRLIYPALLTSVGLNEYIVSIDGQERICFIGWHRNILTGRE